MNRSLSSICIVLLVVTSTFAVLASSGWTPQGDSETQKSLRAHILTAPTITEYGISPTNAPSGTLVRTWLTYTDADNDAPTYVRCERATLGAVAFLQIPANTMLANNSGDTTYSDGKQYYFDWYYFPFVFTGFIGFLVKSSTDAQVAKFVVCYQEAAPTLIHSGVTPMDHVEGNYTFFTNYTYLFNAAPSYVQVVLNGVVHSMSKNNSSQVTWVSGVDYSYATNLTAGNNTYSFQTLSTSGVSGKQSSGTYWIVIEAPSSASISLALLIIVVVLCASLVIIWRVK